MFCSCSLMADPAAPCPADPVELPDALFHALQFVNDREHRRNAQPLLEPIPSPEMRPFRLRPERRTPLKRAIRTLACHVVGS